MEWGSPCASQHGFFCVQPGHFSPSTSWIFWPLILSLPHVFLCLWLLRAQVERAPHASSNLASRASGVCTTTGWRHRLRGVAHEAARAKDRVINDALTVLHIAADAVGSGAATAHAAGTSSPRSRGMQPLVQPLSSQPADGADGGRGCAARSTAPAARAAVGAALSRAASPCTPPAPSPPVAAHASLSAASPRLTAAAAPPVAGSAAPSVAPSFAPACG